MKNGKDEDPNEGVITKDGSSGDRWPGIGMEVVTGRGGEKGSEDAINKFVSMVRCSTGAFYWDASQYCTSGDELSRQSSWNWKMSSSIIETGAWTER